MPGTVTPPRALHAVRCRLHDTPDPRRCTSCYTGININRRLLHERGECPGPGICYWCSYFGARNAQ